MWSWGYVAVSLCLIESRSVCLQLCSVVPVERRVDMFNELQCVLALCDSVVHNIVFGRRLRINAFTLRNCQCAAPDGAVDVVLTAPPRPAAKRLPILNELGHASTGVSQAVPVHPALPQLCAGNATVIDDDDVKLFEEDATVRSAKSVEWMLPGEFVVQLLLLRKLQQIGNSWILEQLSHSGVKFEQDEQYKFLTTNSRTYQAVLAYESGSTLDAMSHATRHITCSSEWLASQHKSEQVQLDIFLVMSRFGGAAAGLVWARNRNYPYKTLAGVKYPALLDELRGMCPNDLIRTLSPTLRTTVMQSVGLRPSLN